MGRKAVISRVTKETDISLELELEGGDVSVQTGIGFFDHALNAFACHGGFGLKLLAKGDLEIDEHHTMEDIGLALGQAFKDALGDKRGITRFGESHVPMDEALARCVVDLSGRPYLGWRCDFPFPEVGRVNVRLFREFAKSFVNVAGLSMHVDLLACDEVHHGMEAIFKAMGRALRQAVDLRPGKKEVLSTKGSLLYN